MRTGDTDFSELSDLAGLGGLGSYNGGSARWGSAHGGQTWGRTPQTGPQHASAQHTATSSFHNAGSGGRNSYEAEDVMIQYAGGRSGSAGRGRSGLYYSPPGTSYTIVERPASASRPNTPHSYYGNTSKLNPRGTYLGSSTVISGSNSNFNTGNAGVTSSRHSVTGSRAVPGSKKRPISPEQVLRLFGPQSGGRNTAGGRRTGPSPASSPPSTTHQAGYREQRSVQHSVPNIHELCTRTVAMSRDPPDGSHGFGICVKGGKDAGVGVYISRVEEGSVAERAGLRPGDSILEVNGTPFTAISHEEALKMLKSCRQLSMTVRSPTLPAQAGGNNAASGGYLMRQTCSWMDRQGRPVSPPMEYGRHATTGPGRYSASLRERGVRRVDLCIEPGQSLGLMIRGGVEYSLGIYITGVDKESVADRAGLLIGDQILEVNGQSFMDVTHDEAVNQLKFHKRMSLLVRDVGKVPHSCTAYDHDGAWDSASPTSPGPRRSAAQQMVEQKARSLLPRSEFSTLCYYLQEYCSRNMACIPFLTCLLEMLDTPDKHTLLTELREIIFPEDKARFDEMVYRRTPGEVSGHIGDVHGGHGDVLGSRIHSRRKMDNHGNMHGHDMQGDGSGIGGVVGFADDFVDDNGRSPSEDSGLGLAAQDRQSRATHRGRTRPPTSGTAPSNDDEQDTMAQDFVTDEDIAAGRGSRRHSSPGESREGSHTALHRTDYDDSDQCGYLDGLRSQLGGLTQRVKSWYWGRPLELAHKLSRSFDMKEDSALLGPGGSGGPVRRHQSMSRLGPTSPEVQNCVRAVSDQQGNLHVTVQKTKPILGIAIEGGANTKHPLPRIINIHEHGAAFSAGGLEVGQLILEVDGHSVEGMPHQDVARLIAECFARRDTPDISFLVIEAKKSNLEPKPTALIFLEA